MTPSPGDNLPTLLAEGKFVQLIRQGTWEYATRTGGTRGVAIVALTQAQHLILVEQYRIPVQTRTIELPAGLIGDEADPHETVETAARRELLEETGYEADSLIELTHGPVSAGFSAEMVHLVRASGLRKVHGGGGTEHESIVVHEIPLSEIHHHLKIAEERGCLVDPKVYAGLYFLLQK